MNWYSILHTWKMIKILLVTCGILFIVRGFIIEPGRINGRSMEPNFIDEDIFVTNKISLLFTYPKRGDLIQFKTRVNELYVKRIIGLPGEQVKISKNKVYIIHQDGSETKLSENYLPQNTITQSLSKDTTIYPIIPKFQYFVLGDNRDDSTDSRVFGNVHRNQMLGFVL